MSDSDKDENTVWGYVVVAAVTAALVYSFTKPKDTAQEDAPRIPTTSLTPPIVETTSAANPIPIPSAIPPPAPAPSHFYDAVEGSTYLYARAISEDDRKSGKQAPDMLAFRYLGRDADGKDRVQNVTWGGGQWISTCARPCKVIHNGDGTMFGFDSGSIIGAVFMDAQRGFLKRYKPPPPPVPTPAPYKSDTGYQYYDNDGNLVPSSDTSGSPN